MDAESGGTALDGTAEDGAFDVALDLLRRSGEVHRRWYLERYPDVARLRMDPAEHYLRYGARMGRAPNRRVGMPGRADAEEPLLRRLLRQGASAGSRSFTEEARVDEAIETLHALGYVDWSLDALREVAEGGASPGARAVAARELARWHLLRARPADPARAIRWLDRAIRDTEAPGERAKLVGIQLVCDHALGDTSGGLARFGRAVRAGETLPDTYLARANLEDAAEGRCAWINRALAGHGVPPVALGPDDGRAPYDRLIGAAPLPAVTEGPLVTVLLAAYDSAAMIGTALRSLRAQTWRALEIVVIDDCSPDGGATLRAAEAAAQGDPRVRTLRMERNGGAYVARNRGLDLASGTFVTIHDADDWSHPLKIETQARHLLAHPEVMGCTSDQARANDALRFTRPRSNGLFTIFNTSSFMFRRAPVREALGYWDSVRFAADTELIRRMEAVFGAASYAKVPTGPLSFQREAPLSVTGNAVTGLSDRFFGVRKEYRDAQAHHHRNAASLRYAADPARRPFAAPRMMHPDRPGPGPRELDLVIAGDFRVPTPEIGALIAELPALRARHPRIGLVERYEFDALAPDGHAICAALRAQVDGAGVEVLVHGDTVVARHRRTVGDVPDEPHLAPVILDPAEG